MVDVRPENRIDQKLPRQNPPPRLNQSVKEVELGGCQVERLVAQPGDAPRWVHRNVAITHR